MCVFVYAEQVARDSLFFHSQLNAKSYKGRAVLTWHQREYSHHRDPKSYNSPLCCQRNSPSQCLPL